MASRKSSTPLRGFLRRPTSDELLELARAEHLALNEADLEIFHEQFDVLLTGLDQLNAYVVDEPLPRWTNRKVGQLATSENDPLNAVVRWCDVEGARTGPLAGRTVALKDNIALAGIPVTNSSRTAAFTPTLDAIVVERLLDAGARIVAKTNLDDYSSGGTGESSVFGPALNPYEHTRSGGGSSGGSGVAVATGLVDVALGVDQGGSARIPASFNGVVSLKATHGRIPTFGITYMDHTLDYVCPIARTVADVAMVTDVLTGPDDRDPQSTSVFATKSRCVEALETSVSNMTVAIVEEAASPDFCTPDVLAAFDATIAALEAQGVTVIRRSVPLWTEDWALEASVLAHLGWATAQSEGIGGSHRGYVDADRVHAFARSRRTEADDYAPSFKAWLLTGRYLRDRYFNTTLATTMNLRLMLTRQVDTALDQVDALVMPTTPRVATPLLTEPQGELELTRRGTLTSGNTCPTNLTGHPSLAVPNGRGEADLPTSIQIVATRGADETTFSIGAAIEAAAPSTSTLFA